MSQFSKTFTSTASTYTNPGPDVTVPFEPKRLKLINESATADCYVSFDGKNDHVHLLAMAAATGWGATTEFYVSSPTKVWVRDGGGHGVVTVEAER